MVFIFVINAELLFADAGSVLVFFGIFHLLVLNAFIGIGESLILRAMRIKNSMLWIIAGNYISMVFGMLIISPYYIRRWGLPDFFFGESREYHYHLTGDYYLVVYFITMAFSFLASLIIEFPFFYFGIKKEYRSKTLKGLLIANLISYIVISLIYLLFVIAELK
ncbi:hypothetical protein [uncultured Acetobacteroides sp.]|uniref:hypothetical protein n=1 Tax=uncultured Acetobacteroides sp. TaxID=1760811 RepID=UPI0029F4DDC1|nr:hypothetical protein [uncultured Acetobacteroides sp.]